MDNDNNLDFKHTTTTTTTNPTGSLTMNNSFNGNQTDILNTEHMFMFGEVYLMGYVPPWISVLYIVVNVLVIFLGVSGNAVIIHIYNTARPKTPCDWFILLIAYLDLIVCFCYPLLNLRLEMGMTEMFDAKGVFCAVESLISLSAMLASCCLLGMVALERYIKVCKPTIASMSGDTAKVICYGSIIISVVVCSYPSYYHIKEAKCVMSNAGGFSKIYMMCLLVFFCACFILVIVCYTNVIKTIELKIKVKQRLFSKEKRSAANNETSDANGEDEGEVFNKPDRKSNCFSCIDAIFVHLKYRHKTNRNKRIVEAGNPISKFKQRKVRDKDDRIEKVKKTRKNIFRLKAFSKKLGESKKSKDRYLDTHNVARLSTFEFPSAVISSYGDGSTQSYDEGSCETAILCHSPVNEAIVLPRTSPVTSLQGVCLPEVDGNHYSNTSEFKVYGEQNVGYNCQKSNELINEIGFGSHQPSSQESSEYRCLHRLEQGNNAISTSVQNNDEINVQIRKPNTKSNFCHDSEMFEESKNDSRRLAQTNGKRAASKNGAVGASTSLETTKQNASAWNASGENRSTTADSGPMNHITVQKQQSDESCSVVEELYRDVQPVSSRRANEQMNTIQDRLVKKKPNNSSTCHRRKKWMKERRMTHMLLSITIIFLVSWIPPWFLCLCFIWKHQPFESHMAVRLGYRYFDKTNLLQYCTNYIVYYKFNPRFRLKVNNLMTHLCGWIRCKRAESVGGKYAQNV